MTASNEKFSQLANATLPITGGETVVLVQSGVTVQTTIIQLSVLKSFNIGSLPSASTAGALVFVTDDIGGPVPAFADGTNWRRVSDRAIVKRQPTGWMGGDFAFRPARPSRVATFPSSFFIGRDFPSRFFMGGDFAFRPARPSRVATFPSSFFGVH